MKTKQNLTLSYERGHVAGVSGAQLMAGLTTGWPMANCRDSDRRRFAGGEYTLTLLRVVTYPLSTHMLNR